MPTEDNALQPLNGSDNSLWARVRGSAANMISPSREAQADKENIYPQLSQGRDIEEEREKVKRKEWALLYEHVGNEEEDEGGQAQRDGGEGEIERGSELEDTQEESPFVRGAGRGEFYRTYICTFGGVASADQAEGHREAYKNMTRLAAPLPADQIAQSRRHDSNPGTPAHKRRRIEESVESDGLSDEEASMPARRSPASSLVQTSNERPTGHGHTFSDESVNSEVEGSMNSALEDTTSMLEDLHDETVCCLVLSTSILLTTDSHYTQMISYATVYKMTFRAIDCSRRAIKLCVMTATNSLYRSASGLCGVICNQKLMGKHLNFD